jgi:DNA-binding response OmpR family regulator
MEMGSGRILVVDDDKSILRFIRTILEKKHYVVNTAESAREALSICAKTVFDLALIDIKLPDMHGIELLGRLTDSSMVKIIVTGFPSQQNSIDALNLGADGYLVKPVKPAFLLHSIEEHFEKRKSKTENNYEEAFGMLGDFLSMFQNDREWYKVKELARILNTTKYMVERMTFFSINRGLLKIKYWKEKGIIQVEKKIPMQKRV